MLRRSPGFAFAAILSLALGVGANVAIFSVFHAVLLRMLPVKNPQNLVELLAKYPGQEHFNTFSRQAYQLTKEHNHVFSAVIATTEFYSFFHVRGAGVEPERVYGCYVAGDFFPVLGLNATLGRLIGPEDDDANSPAPVAVVSWAYWKSRLHADMQVVGRKILVDDAPLTIIGVAPRAFSGLQPGVNQNIWMPLAMERVIQPYTLRIPNRKFLEIVARLKPGISLQQARAEMTVLYAQSIAEEAKTNDDPHLRNWTVEVEPAGSGLSALRDRFAKPLVIVMAVVGLLLLITCGGVANMLLARAAGREREMALRISLGASRFRLVRQTLTESLLLAGAAALVGVLLGYAGSTVLVNIMASGLEHIQLKTRPDVTVLLFAAGIALTTGVLFGMAPALYALRRETTSSLHGMQAMGESKFKRTMGKGLVVVQVALSVSLLSAAWLFARHLSNLENIDLGFQRDHVLVMGLDPSGSTLTAARLLHAYQDLLARLEAIPGVRSATLSSITPISFTGARGPARVEGYTYKSGERRFLAKDWVAPRYFETFGIPLLAGRDFEPHDESRSRVAVINKMLARYYFGNASPIGKHVLFDGDTKPYEIVGVVGDANYSAINDAPRTIYLDAFQDWNSHAWSQFAIRTAVRPAAITSQVRQAVRDVLKTVPVVQINTMAEQVDASIVPERLIATLSGFFGALAAVIVAIGLYGLLAYRVTRRTNEIGIRMALGAVRSDVVWMIISDTLSTVCAGMVLALPLLFWVKKLAASMIQDAEARSLAPVAFAAVAMVIIAVAAAYVPTKRAAAVEPMQALRHE